VAEILQPHSQGETLEGPVAKGCPHRGILLHLLCCLVVDKVIKRLDGNACYTGVCTIFISGKFLITVSRAFSGGFEYGTAVG